jgi:hypothetical protein
MTSINAQAGLVGRGYFTGTIIQGRGRLQFYSNARAFIRNNTAWGDSVAVWWWGGLNRRSQTTDVGSWTDVVNGLNGANGLNAIYLSGHGCAGGVSCQNGCLNASSLTDAQVTAIQQALGPGGMIVLLGCEIVNGRNYARAAQDLANRLGVPVIGNTGSVSEGNYGDGSWVRFVPR